MLTSATPVEANAMGESVVPLPVGRFARDRRPLPLALVRRVKTEVRNELAPDRPRVEDRPQAPLPRRRR
jgi:hypothetical protein